MDELTRILHSKKRNKVEEVLFVLWHTVHGKEQLAIDAMNYYAALIDAAREVNQAYAKSSEFKMHDGSPCWCGRTDRHTVHCEIKRTQYGNLAALLPDAARKGN